MRDFIALLDQAAASGDLLESSAANIRALLAANPDSVSRESVRELLERGDWRELDDRFFRTLAFGTGGLRGKTIGGRVTTAEQGAGGPNGRPEHPCTGANAMNFTNVDRATRGLAAYVRDFHARERRPGIPSICIAHDTRHFSREFAEFAAQVIVENGCDARLFESARSTPELSFAVRLTKSTAGINLTASHNPPEYNGYKVYFEDGGQIVEPHASGIIGRVNAIAPGASAPLPPGQHGRILPMGAEIDDAYLDRLESLVLDPAVIRGHPVKIVYTPLHGVGAVTVRPILERLGLPVSIVAAQEMPDGRFPTVESPNPENSEALTLAIEQANREGADLVLATDPDDDRLGAAARNDAGAMQLLDGNQLGALMAWYRATKFIDLGLLGADHSRGVIVKTFVTSDLQRAIAAKLGLRCVETLTGFKYLGAKLAKYEAERERIGPDRASHFVFGSEESHGYSGADFVRDKDGNGAVVMLAETACHARSRGLTLPGLLDRIHGEFGYFLERGESLVMDGAEGAARIRSLVASYAACPPGEIGGRRVESIRNFATESLTDVEGDPIPPEAMLMFTIEGGFRVAVRPSGTEPKIKYYLFARRDPAAGAAITAAALAQIKRDTAAALASLWNALKSDAAARLGA